MVKKYDVIVVGAGLAGFLAAKAAGENGLTVALLEKNTDLTQHIRPCGETLTSMAEYWLGNIVGFNNRDKRIFFSSDGFSFKYDGPYQDIYGMRIYSPNGHKIELGNLEEQRKKGHYGRVSISFDKDSMFKGLLEEVKACSVDFFPGVNVQKVISNAEEVIVEGSGQSFRGSYCIAADGTNSRVAQAIGMNQGRIYYCTLYAISHYLSNVEPPDSNAIIITYGYLREGPAILFLFPRTVEGEYNLLVVTVNPRVDLEVAIDYFMKDAFCASWFKNAKKLRTFSTNEKCYSPIVEPYKDRVLVAGDVGATQELENSGAMISGWKAGQAISKAVQEENLELEVIGITQYINWWKEAYINYYDQELYIKAAMSTPYVLTKAEDMDYVYSLIKETLPACWHPYTPGVHVTRAIRKIIPIIQQERPDILNKLAKGNLPATEIFAEVANISKST
jgi:digeranylgeranylglycerophospholipid reductase